MSIRRNTAYNLIGSLAPLAISLLTVPIYLRLIGEERYGVLAIAWMLLGYFGLFDLGLGRATAQRIASLSNGTISQRTDAFWTALGLNVGLGVFGGLIIWPIASVFLGELLKIDDTMRLEVDAAVPWLVLAVPVSTLSAVLTGALQGRERFLELNLISSISSVLFQLIPLAAAFIWGSDLGILLPTALFARIFTLVALYRSCSRHVFFGYPVAFVRAEANCLLRFGGWITITSIVRPLMVVLDRFIIGAMLGAKAVSYYTVPMQLVDRSGIIPFALSSALFPRFAAASREKEQELARNSLSAVASVMTPMMVTGIVLIEPFLSWWISPDFSREAGPVGRVLLLGYWANSLVLISYAQLDARGRPDLAAKCNLIELLPYLGMLYLGLNMFGLVGAAAAFSVRIFFDLILLAVISGMAKYILHTMLIPLLLMGSAFLIAAHFKYESTEWYLVIVIISIMTIIWSWRQAPAQLRSLLLLKIGKTSNWFAERLR
jgi:O-antigen/teichoic acid export membrane protein